MRLAALPVLLFALAGCNGEYRFDETADAAPADDAGARAADDAGEGIGTIGGSVGGRTFNQISAALWIAAPDDEAAIAIYVFEKPVLCDTVSVPGWEGHLAAGGQVLEMAYFASQTGSYAITDDLVHAPTTAEVEYIPDADERREILSSGGTVTLDMVVPNVHAVGTFDAQMGTTSLRGSFDAVFCPRGTEP